MTTDEFWTLTSRINQTALTSGDEYEAVAPLVHALSALPEEQIQSYEEILCHLLYEIDGEQFADCAGEAGESGDGFLYCRCYVVARGRDFYERVLADPSRIPKTLEEWCEPLLSVTAEAWAAAKGRDPEEWDYTAQVSYETGSHAALWSSSQQSTDFISAETDPFVEPVLQRAVARAGHAFRAGQYENVVKLLQPHAPELSKKQLRMLENARSKLG